ncbi:MAG: hypothetical protein WCI00_00480 [bacterium]
MTYTGFGLKVNVQLRFCGGGFTVIGAVHTDDHALLLTVILKVYAPVCVGVIVR